MGPRTPARTAPGTPVPFTPLGLGAEYCSGSGVRPKPRSTCPEALPSDVEIDMRQLDAYPANSSRCSRYPDLLGRRGCDSPPGVATTDGASPATSCGPFSAISPYTARQKLPSRIVYMDHIVTHELPNKPQQNFFLASRLRRRTPRSLHPRRSMTTRPLDDRKNRT